MSTLKREFNRAPRQRRPLPRDEVKIPDPPTISTSATSTPLWLMVLPAGATLLGVALMMVSGGNMSTVIFSAVFMLVSYGASILTYVYQNRAQKKERRKKEEGYRRSLETVEQKLAGLAKEQQEVRRWTDPDVDECLQWALDRSSRLWERSPQDDDFLSLRLGIGSLPSSVTIKAPEPSTGQVGDDPTESLRREAAALAQRFATVSEVPITISLPDVGVLGIAGPCSQTASLSRALLCHLVAHHSPDEVKIAAFFSNEDDWAWLRWLPHVHPHEGESRRRLACTSKQVRALANELQEEWNRRLARSEARAGNEPPPLPRLVILAEHPHALGETAIRKAMEEGKRLGAYVITLAERSADLPHQCGAVVELRVNGKARCAFTSAPGHPVEFEPDVADLNQAEQLSRALAPVYPARTTGAEELPTLVRLMELYSVDRVEELDAWQFWTANRPYRDRSLAAPIGIREGGRLRYLDLYDSESADGPHGLTGGTTGSGKTEMLQTLITSLAIRYHPHDLNFLLVDLKAYDLPKGLEALPHLVGVAANDKETIEVARRLIARALTALKAELGRRGKLLKEARVSNIDQYQRLHYEKGYKEILPRLIVVVDEFRELAKAEPELVDDLVTLAAQGRFVGLHLILATQQPAGVVSDQIQANVNFRLCLRMTRTEDSQAVIGGPDAAFISHRGRAYLKVGEGRPEPVQIARSRAAYHPTGASKAEVPSIVEVALDGERHLLWSEGETKRGAEGEAETWEVQAICSYLRRVAEEHDLLKDVRQLWLNPLPPRLFLPDLLTARGDGGWDGGTWRPTDRRLRPVIGRLDDPARQRQPPLEPDLGRRGHLFICGGPGSGKSTALRTLIISLAMAHSPDALHLYCLDFGTFALQVFERLPHVGAVIRPDEPERVQRLFRWLLEELDTRKRWLVQHGAVSLPAAHARGIDDAPAALVLVVDNFASLRDGYPNAMDILAQLAREGQAVGIHLVLAADRPTALPPGVLSNVSLRMALQLTDAADYGMIVGHTGGLIPESLPGRGLWGGEAVLECQVALPVAGETEAEREANLRGLIGEMERAWSDRERPMPIGVLPSVVPFSDILLPAPTDRWPDHPPGAPLRVPLGWDDLTLAPIGVDLAADGPHFLVTGPPQSGKTTVLHTWLLALAETFPPEMVQFILFDTFKESLGALSDLPHVRYLAVGEEEQRKVLGDLRAIFQRRRAERRARHRLPILVLVADDCEFLTSDTVKSQLEQHARHDHPLGFHLLLAGPVAEMGRYDTLYRQVLANRSGLLVGSNDLIQDSAVFNLSIPRSQAGRPLPPGRGYLVRRGQARLVQVATAGDEAAVREWVRRIAARKE